MIGGAREKPTPKSGIVRQGHVLQKHSREGTGKEIRRLSIVLIVG